MSKNKPTISTKRSTITNEDKRDSFQDDRDRKIGDALADAQPSRDDEVEGVDEADLMANDNAAPEIRKNVREYKGEREFDHDLFKLEVAKFKKNISYDPKRPNYVPTEHVHFYHSHDSNGKANIASNSVGGHCHLVEVVELANGEFQMKCSPPKKYFKGKYYDFKNKDDMHTHDVSYIVSERLTSRKLNGNAAKAFSYFTSEQSVKDSANEFNQRYAESVD